MAQKRNRLPTIRDVALRAGVSPATVSNVLSGVRGVTQDRRRLVLEAVDALGYKSNHMASSLRLGKTRTIGVVVPNLANEFYSGLVRGWEQQASKSQHEILVVASGENEDTEMRRIESVIARRVDGLLVVPAADDFGSAPGFRANLPATVLVDRASGHPAFDTIASDNFEAGFRGTNYLLEMGHRKVSLLISASDHIHLRERIDGYRQALAQAGLAHEERIVFGGGSTEECRSAIEQDLRRPDRPTAVFAATYFATLGAIKAIRSLDIAFPDKISLMAFEHSEWMTVFRPYITAVSQSVDDLATRSWAVLMERIGGGTEAFARIRIPCRFNARESVTPPGNGR